MTPEDGSTRAQRGDAAEPLPPHGAASTAGRSIITAEELDARRERIRRWWCGDGLIWAPAPPRFGLSDGVTAEAAYDHPRESAEIRDHEVRTWPWLGDGVPNASTYIGPGSLAIFLGSRPETVDDSVWFHARQGWDGDPAAIVFDETDPWWRKTVALIEAMREHATDGAYLIACPDLVENWDILASLLGTSTLLMDMLDQPERVHAQLSAVDRVYVEVFNRIYAMIRDEDGAMVFGAFQLWGPGKTAKIQCDGSAMFSPEMFEAFVVPGLAEQCSYLDYSMYHLDGTQCISHLEHVLSIEALNAVEWTPQAGIPGGTDSRWYPLYRRILEHGKSVQILVDRVDRVADLLNAVGTDGVYLLGMDVDGDALGQTVARFRP